MKKNIKVYALSLLIGFVMFSCAPVRRTTQPESPRQERPTTPRQERPTTTPRTERTTTTNNDIYVQSMQFLKNNASDITDYCVTWVGTPHKMGGMNRDGVDCSGFVCNVYQDVYNVKLPRNSGKMQQECKIYKSITQLKEGDLLFFGKDNVNHVGIFIKKDKFVHASTSKGVIVSSVEEKYWKENFHSCGHHPQVKN